MEGNEGKTSDLKLEITSLETRLEGLGSMADMIKATVNEELGKSGTGRRKYVAEVVRKKEEESHTEDNWSKKASSQPSPKVVILRQEQKMSADVKKKLRELVRLSEIGLKV